MARSTYVYLVVEKGHATNRNREWVPDRVHGTFTVKREAHSKVPLPYREQYKLMRFKDGELGEGEEIPWDTVKLPNKDRAYKALMARAEQLKQEPA